MLDILSTTDRWILCGALFTLFTLFAGVNLIYFVSKAASGFAYGPSYLPFVGGLSGVVGLLIMPVATVSDRLLWLWVPLLLDASCLPMVMVALYFRLTKNRSRK